MPDSAKDRIIVALDVPTRKAALDLVDRLGSEATFFKVGAQLFAEEGPSLLEDLKKRDKRVFLDLKFHDIPNTVAGGVRAAMRHGAHMLTVHASGGAAMLAAAREAAGADGPVVVAVTLLTSLAAEDVEQVFGRAPASWWMRSCGSPGWRPPRGSGCRGVSHGSEVDQAELRRKTEGRHPRDQACG